MTTQAMIGTVITESDVMVVDQRTAGDGLGLFNRDKKHAV